MWWSAAAALLGPTAAGGGGHAPFPTLGSSPQSPLKSKYHQLESSNPVLAVLGRSQKSIPKIIRKWFPTLEKHTKIVPGSLPGPAGGPRKRPKPKKAMRTRSRRAPKRHPKQRKCAGSAPRCPKRSAKLEKCGLQRRILTEPAFELIF